MLSRFYRHCRSLSVTTRLFATMQDQPPQPKYPGLGLDLRHYASGFWGGPPCYPIGVCEHLQGATSDLLQLREVFMLAVMDRLSDKPDWDRKVFDGAIVAKWRAEALQMPEEGLYRLATEHVEPRLYGESKMPLPERARYLSGEAFDYVCVYLWPAIRALTRIDPIANCV